MNNERKVCVVISARPSYSRVRTVLRSIEKHHNLELQIVLCASSVLERYGNVESQVNADGFEVTQRIYNLVEGNEPIAMAKTLGLGVIELSSCFATIAPDIVVTVADRYETLATAVAASYMNIPLAHIQGGEVSGSIDNRVRNAVTKLADLHFPATKLAGDRILQMGEARERIFPFGCPSIDLVASIPLEGRLSFDPFIEGGGVGPIFDPNQKYAIVIMHPVTNEFAASRSQAESLVEAISESRIPTFWFWPNVDAGSDGTSKALRSFREKDTMAKIHFFKNLSPEKFLELLAQSSCIVGNSSAGIREASFLGVPAVNIGSRQAGRERAENVFDVGYEKTQILSGIGRQSNLGRCPKSNLYGVGDAGDRIAEALAEVPLVQDRGFVDGQNIL